MVSASVLLVWKAEDFVELKAVEATSYFLVVGSNVAVDNPLTIVHEG